MGAQFEYDERGFTFYYFLVSFYALVLIPATYYLWPRSSKKDTLSELKSCRCDGCRRKDESKKSGEPWTKFKHRVVKVIFLLLWVGFFSLAYKASQIKDDHVEWNPYTVLGLDSGASVEEVKKAYRQLSKIHHPDRGGEEKRFVEITKAHLSLTNEESKKNYDMYGNPDGPGAQSFGIALPSWLVSKEYSIWVLAVYGLIFMVIMPTAVGIWWYKSIKYSADSVLMDTTQMFTFMMHKTSLLNVKRVIAILSGSFEFWKQYNKEVIERPSDDVELPALMKHFPSVNDNKKERPLCIPYSVKARLLIYSHLSRHSLYADLAKDLQLILKKCPYLVQELIQVYSQLVMLANAGRIQRMPALETLDNIVKVCPMIIQATWDSKSSIFQLPHITDDVIRHFVTKKRFVKSCADLAKIPNEERRTLLRNLQDHEYRDVCLVLSSMPHIEMEVRLEVRDDEDKERVTAGALVIAVVKLKRTPLLDPSTVKSTGSGYQQQKNPLNNNPSTYSAIPHVSSASANNANDSANRTEEDSDENDEQDGAGADGEQNENGGESVQQQQQPAKKSMWEKQKRKKGGKNAAKNKKKQNFKPTVPGGKKPEPSTTLVASASGSTLARSDEQQTEKAKREGDSEAEGSGDEKEDNSSDDEALKEVGKPNQDDDDFDLDEDFTRKEKILETKSKITHPVHCPHYPDDKYEYWWLYMCDRKKRQLICPAVPVTTLVDTEEVELRFAAPKDPGSYSMQVCLRSDSYLDCDQNKDIKYVVHEAKQITSHPQWEFAEDEDNKSEHEASDDDGSEYTEDDEDSN